MLSFRTRLDLGYLVVFGVCLGLLFPASSWVVDKLVQRSLRDKTNHVVAVVRSASSLNDLIRRLERQPPLLHRISVFRTGGELVYDSEKARFGPMVPPQIYMAMHPEVPQAFEKGYGYGQFYSETLKQVLVHMAVRVDFGVDQLVIRTAFPLSEVEDLTYWFKVGFFSIGIGLLCLFMAIVILVGYHLSAPIRRMMAALRPYYEGRTETLPRVRIERGSRRDEVVRLAETINDLSRRTADHISDLRFERSERETILSYLSEGVVIVDRGQTVIYANAMALRLLGGIVRADREPEIHHRELRELVMRCLDEEQLVTKRVSIGGENPGIVDATVVPRGQARGAILILQRRVLRPQLPILESPDKRPRAFRMEEVARRLRIDAIRSVSSKRIRAIVRF